MISKLFRLLGMTDHTEPSSDVLGDTDDGSNAPDSGLPEEAETAELVQILYPELKRLARIHMRRERVDHTLQPTALVSEVFLKLAVRPDVQWRDRSHFLRAATRAMRLLLIDHARKHGAEKNGGGVVKIDISDDEARTDERSLEYILVDQLLRKMATVDARMAEVVELKVFGGLNFAEIGEVLAVNERTAKRDWHVARAWLFGHLRGSTTG